MGAARERQETRDEHGVHVEERETAEHDLARPDRVAERRETLHALATSFPWVRIASFGSPVVPPVANHDDSYGESAGRSRAPTVLGAIAAPKSCTPTCFGARRPRPRRPLSAASRSGHEHDVLREERPRERLAEPLPALGPRPARG